MKADFLTDIYDEYKPGGCPSCGSGCARLTLDTMVGTQWVFCYSCHCEEPAVFDSSIRLEKYRLEATITDGTARDAFLLIGGKA